MDFLDEYMLPVVLGICLCVGFVLKKWITDLENKYIPTIVSGLGIFLAVWLNDFQVTPDAILGGMISGLASTGMYELFRQYISGEK